MSIDITLTATKNNVWAIVSVCTCTMMIAQDYVCTRQCLHQDYVCIPIHAQRYLQNSACTTMPEQLRFCILIQNSMYYVQSYG